MTRAEVHELVKRMKIRIVADDLHGITVRRGGIGADEDWRIRSGSGIGGRGGHWTMVRLPDASETLPACSTVEEMERTLREWRGAPDMVWKSGREDMSDADRIVLLRSDMVALKANSMPTLPWDWKERPPYSQWSEDDKLTWQRTGSTIHEFNSLMGYASAVCTNIEQATAKGDLPRVAGLRTRLSGVECRIMAWKRGGYAESVKIRDIHMRPVSSHGKP